VKKRLMKAVAIVLSVAGLLALYVYSHYYPPQADPLGVWILAPKSPAK